MYILPEALRNALKQPVGELIQEDRLSELLEGADPIIGVGDVTCLTLLDRGYLPKLMLIDYKNERNVMAPDDPRRVKLASHGDNCIQVENPPAVITDELEEAISKALTSEGTWRIEIEGEEDLAVLPCMVRARGDARIVYGMPGEGLVVVHNTVDRVMWAQAFLARMERPDEAGPEEDPA